jgi:hypothetical protein
MTKETTMATKQQHHHRRFPRTVARFLQLEGGQYGTLDLVAITDDKLELQLGADFVQFTREQAEDLRDAVQKFLDYERDEKDAREDRREERAIGRAILEAEEALEREPESPPPPARRRRTRATATT